MQKYGHSPTKATFTESLKRIFQVFPLLICLYFTVQRSPRPKVEYKKEGTLKKYLDSNIR